MLVAAITRTSTDLLGAPAEAAEAALLQHAQQLDLRRRRHLADLVEEQRAAVRQLEAALPPIGRAGEGALLVAEDFALEQRLGNRGAVDGDERKAGARAQLVDGLRDQLLAGARLAGDEHRRRGRRRLLDHLIDLAHLGAVADERAERAVLAQLAAQRLHLAHRLEPLDDLVEQDLQPLNVDRLGQVVVGAFLHRLDRGVDGALRGQQQRRHVGADLRQRAQQREPVHARHHHVGDDDRRTERRDLLERFFAVARRLGDEAPAPDELFEPDARGGVVLDDQHALSGDLRFGFDDLWSSGCNHRSSHPQPCHFYILGVRAQPMQAERLRKCSTSTAGGDFAPWPADGGEMRITIVQRCWWRASLVDRLQPDRCRRTPGNALASPGERRRRRAQPAPVATAGRADAPRARGGRLPRPARRARSRFPRAPR